MLYQILGTEWQELSIKCNDDSTKLAIAKFEIIIIMYYPLAQRDRNVKEDFEWL